MVKVDYDDTWQAHVNDKEMYKNRCRLYLVNSLALLKSRVQLALLMPAIKMILTSEDGNLYLFYVVSSDTTKGLHNLIHAIRENDELINHFPYNQSTHVVVVRPEINYDAFLEGRYSEIYTKQQIKICFTKDSISRRVVTRSAHSEFADFIKSEFGTTVEINPKQECDIPCSYKQEVYV